MVRQAWIGGWCAALLLLAGCTSEDDAGAQDDPGAEVAGPATFTAETGGIEGVVLNDEQLPVANAQIGILALELTTMTDPQGRFSFSNLPPGTHDLHAQALGYEAAGQKVTVMAGQVTTVEVPLTAVAIE